MTNATIYSDMTLTTAADAIRPFHYNATDAELTDLRRRLAATRWPDRETVSDRSQGVQLATMQKLVHDWQTVYDWRKVEAKLKPLTQFVTNMDGIGTDPGKEEAPTWHR